MQLPLDHIDRFILRTVCDELLPLERIIAKAQDSLERDEVDRIAGRLIGLLANRLVDAYLLHAERPFVTRVDNPEISKHWFFISKKGLRLLMELQSKIDPLDTWPAHRVRQRKIPRPRDNFDN